MARGRGQGEENSVGLRGRSRAAAPSASVLQAKMTALIAGDKAASELVKSFDSGIYVVGGAVRDLFFGRDPKDIDMLIRGVDADTLEAKLNELPGSVDYTGKSFGVFRYRLKGDEVEIALPRKERSTGDDHKDFEVIADPELSIEDDLWRRDYTVNAMGWDVANNRVVDPYGGREDVANGVLRPVREEALSEDPLRILRGAVLVARYDLSVNDAVKRQLVANKHHISTLSTERIADELRKLAVAPHWQKGLELMNKLEILPVQLHAARGEGLAPDLRLASFFYEAREQRETLHHNYNLSNQEQKILSGLWRAHDLAPELECDDAEFRQYMRTATVGNINNYALMTDDNRLLSRLRRQESEPHRLQDLVVGGADLIEQGMKPGPEFKSILGKMLDVVVANPDKNTREELLAVAFKAE